MKVPAALSIATFLAIALGTGASAQDATAEGVQAELSGGAVLGVAAANVAAGDGNQQANVGLIAMGEKGLSIGSVAQTTSRPAAAQTASAQSGIADGAFGGSSGWIATNIAAGSANQQANIAAIAIGVSGQALNADMLSQTRAPSTKEDVVKIGDKPADLATHIGGDGAFAGSSGLVQVNVAAGDGNTSANVFGLSIAEP